MDMVRQKPPWTTPGRGIVQWRQEKRCSEQFFAFPRSTFCSIIAQLTEETQPLFETTLKSRAVSEDSDVRFTCIVTGNEAVCMICARAATQVRVQRVCGHRHGEGLAVQVDIGLLSYLSSLTSLCGWGSLSPPTLKPHIHPAVLQNLSSIQVPHTQTCICD